MAMKRSEAGRWDAAGAVRGQSHWEKQRRAGAALLPGRRQAQRRGERQAGGWRSACSLLRKVRRQGKSWMASIEWIGWGRSAAAPPPACRSAAGGRDSSWRRQHSPLGAVGLGQPLSAPPSGGRGQSETLLPVSLGQQVKRHAGPCCACEAALGSAMPRRAAGAASLVVGPHHTGTVGVSGRGALHAGGGGLQAGRRAGSGSSGGHEKVQCVGKDS